MNLGPSIGETSGFLLVVSFFWFFSGWNPLRTEVYEYTLYCPQELVDGACPVREETGKITTYKANFDNQVVIVWSENKPPRKLENCAVRDVSNWSCSSGDVDAQFVQEMIDGRYDYRKNSLPDWTSVFKKHWHAVPKWKWWMIKIREF